MTPENVTRYIAELDHPLKNEILLMRSVILCANDKITECIKWNTLSYYCGGDFATFHPREKKCVQLILHNGAKVKNANLQTLIHDDTQLLVWLAKDRATLKLKDAGAIEQNRKALSELINKWIAAITTDTEGK